MTPEEFAKQWYAVEEFRQMLADPFRQMPPMDSELFAEWLTSHIRSAMVKGIQVGREWHYVQEHCNASEVVYAGVESPSEEVGDRPFVSSSLASQECAIRDCGAGAEAAVWTETVRCHIDRHEWSAIEALGSQDPPRRRARRAIPLPEVTCDPEGFVGCRHCGYRFGVISPGGVIVWGRYRCPDCKSEFVLVGKADD